ncbi:MAG: bifunctional acetate--CoA ligase family protein/GNAT family N-acetyltransferase [Aquisalimonadaceae bacterium]
MSTHYLDRFFRPDSVAVIGASDSPGSVGAQIMENLVEGGYRGRILPVNPRPQTIGGLPAAGSVGELREIPDLAVITVSPRHVNSVLNDCGRHGIKAALILGPGLNEPGGGSKRVEQAALETARRHGIRIIGPDWVGLMRPGIGLNATYGRINARPGQLALVSQSGAVTSAALDWAAARRIGFSAVVSLGDTSDVDFGDVLDFLALDPATRSILLYVETVDHARSFVSGLRAAARLKPVIVMKPGRHRESYRAAGSHTGALVGADDAFDAALGRAGAVRVPTIGQLFASAELLAGGRRLAGDRIAVLTNGGGPGIIATDLLVSRGLALAELSAVTVAGLNRHLPGRWPRANPVNIVGDADAERYAKALDHCLRDPAVDGSLVILTPQARTDPDATADAVMAAADNSRKPVLACWMGGNHIRGGRERFTMNGFPNYATPENAVEALSALSRYRHSQALLMQVADAPAVQAEPDVAAARGLVRRALDAGRRRLTPAESKAVLEAFHIPVTPTLVARSPQEAREAAEAVGLPVALKINAAEIDHKAEIGGVQLNLLNADAVEEAWRTVTDAVAAARPDVTPDGCSVEPMHSPRNGREVMLGVVRDPVFGPVISFGAGGSMVEVINDNAVSLPPLNDFLARDLIRRTRVARSLGLDRQGGSSPALRDLEQALLRLSDLICTLPEVTELDINPMIVGADNAVAVDARLHIRPAAEDNTYSHMAIMPYPAHLARKLTLRDGTEITVRPIRPEDARMEAEFVRALSAQSRYFRFMKYMNELSNPLLIRFTQIDYDREMAFVAIRDGERGPVELGVARYVTNPDGRSCEFAVAVADAWHRKGIGRLLMTELINTARDRGLERMEGQILNDNRSMLALMDRLGFIQTRDRDDYQLVNVHRPLDPS